MKARYIVEWLDSKTLTTYEEKGQNFEVLPLHGSNVYNLDSKGVVEYWKCWQNETGHTAEDETDICVLWSKTQQKIAMEFITVGKTMGVQTTSPSTWKGSDIDRFLREQCKEPTEDLRAIVRLPRSIKLKGGKEYNISSLAIEVCDSELPSFPDEKNTIKVEENIIPSTMPKPQSRNMASEKEIKEAMNSLAELHRTNGGKING